MTTYEDIAKSLFHVHLAPADHQGFSDINTRIRGWSGPAHYAFFKALVMHPSVERILMLGVYQGRDLAYILSLIERYRSVALAKGQLEVIGVDKFSDTPCADWPEDKRGGSWKQAGFGPAPSFDLAFANLNPMAASKCLTLVSNDDESYLAGLLKTPERPLFDAIYLDTSHDEATVLRQIDQVAPLLKPEGILCGDDYLERPEWGVIAAVRKLRPSHIVFGSIWLAGAHS
jgi:hypothetical protein